MKPTPRTAGPSEEPPKESLLEAVGSRERRKIRARRRKRQGVWFGLGMFGLIGWAVAAPMLLGLAAGVMIDARVPSRYSWTLMLLMVGIAVGCLNAWRWVDRERRAIERERLAGEEDDG